MPKLLRWCGNIELRQRKINYSRLDILDKDDENTQVKNSNYFVIGRLVSDVFDDFPLNTFTKNLNILFMPRHILGSNQMAAIKNTISKVRNMYGC